jgi:hypothetical protein
VNKLNEYDLGQYIQQQVQKINKIDTIVLYLLYYAVDILATCFYDLTVYFVL